MSSSFYQSDQVVKLRELIGGDPEGGWEKAWLAKATPWDAGAAQPPLVELFKGDRIKLPKTGRALVPGCGKGHDAFSIADHLGLQVTGMDISPTALGLARELLKSHPGNVSFEERDFFKMEDEPTFELVSDYTFFQALPPALRVAWAAKMTNIVKPSGFLVVLAYPREAPKDIGPPFGFDADTHASLLGNEWVKVLDEIPSNSSETHVNKDRLIVFQKK